MDRVGCLRLDVTLAATYTIGGHRSIQIVDVRKIRPAHGRMELCKKGKNCTMQLNKFRIDYH